MAKRSKRRPGRPKGSTAERTREATVQFKVLADEKDAYQSAARDAGLSLSAWIRFTLNQSING